MLLLKVDENKKEVLKLAKLSKLSFDDTTIEKVQEDLNNILNYMEELNELDLENIEPLYNVHDIELRLHSDIKKEEMSKERFINNSPKHDENFVSLPVIVGGNDE